MDAANFVATLLPNVKYAMEGMSNPEARDVATDCHKILESINTSVEAAPKAEVAEVLAVSGRGVRRQPWAGRWGVAAGFKHTRHVHACHIPPVRMQSGPCFPAAPSCSTLSPLVCPPHPSPPPQALNKAADAAGASIKGDGAEDAARYVAGMAANLIDVKNFEESEWTQVRAALHVQRGWGPAGWWMPSLHSHYALLHQPPGSSPTWPPPPLPRSLWCPT